MPGSVTTLGGDKPDFSAACEWTGDFARALWIANREMSGGPDAKCSVKPW